MLQQSLRQFAAAQGYQAAIGEWLTEHLERWLTPQRAAAVEVVLVSAGFGFLLGSWLFFLWTAIAD